MIKCPNCGSTAQVKELESKWVSGMYWYGNKYKCQCGCGHQFVYQRVYYEMTETIKIEYLNTYEDHIYTGERFM